MTENDRNPSSGARSESHRSTVRATAERLTLAVSVAIVLGAAAYLVIQALETTSPYLPTRAELRLDQVRREGEQYILPVRITNHGTRTLARLRAEVSFQSPSGKQEVREIELNYLGEQATQVVYLYFAADPRSLHPRFTALTYQLR